MPSFFKPKDNKRRHIISSFETKRLSLQFLLRSAKLSPALKQRLVVTTSTSLSKALTNTVKSRNRCVLTGRAGSVFRYFRLSRITLKQLASSGFLTGVRKSS